MVIILQMEAMHVIGYSTLSIRTWHYEYSVKLLNVWEKKKKEQWQTKTQKKNLTNKMQRKKMSF